MWRPWFEPDISTEVISDDTDVTVIPETDKAQLNNKLHHLDLLDLHLHRSYQKLSKYNITAFNHQPTCSICIYNLNTMY